MNSEERLQGGEKRPVTGYTVREIAQMLRISENGARDLIERGECPVRRVGRLLRIPPQEFHAKYGEAVPIAIAERKAKAES
jgi:excisionase family DNA binding protein